MSESPACKKCGTPKVIMKGKKGQHFIGCPKCIAQVAPTTEKQPEEKKKDRSKSSPPAASAAQKKTAKSWWW